MSSKTFLRVKRQLPKNIEEDNHSVVDEDDVQSDRISEDEGVENNIEVNPPKRKQKKMSAISKADTSDALPAKRPRRQIPDFQTSKMTASQTEKKRPLTLSYDSDPYDPDISAYLEERGKNPYISALKKLLS